MIRRIQLIGPLALVLMLGFSASAMAAGNEALRAPLGEIKWGDSRDQVAEKVKSQMLDKLRQRKDLKNDRVLLQREHTRVVDQANEFKNSYEALDHKSGYQVSVISEEFTRGSGESLMTFKDRVANRYYFFVDGGLYKMVVAYNQQYLKDVGFETFVVQVARKYGRPQDTDFVDVYGEDVLMGATWKGDDTVLNIRNQKEFFGTFTMMFGQRSTVERMQKLRAASAVARPAGDDLSQRVQSLTSVSKGDVDANIVDSIVGNSDFDLNKGRPVDVQKQYAEQQRQQAEEAEKKPVAQKEAPAKTKKSKAKSKKKAPDFGDLEATTGGGDLIIY